MIGAAELIGPSMDTERRLGAASAMRDGQVTYAQITRSPPGRDVGGHCEAACANRPWHAGWHEAGAAAQKRVKERVRYSSDARKPYWISWNAVPLDILPTQ